MRSYFDLDLHGTDLKTEIIAGITSFLATMYIIVVNPAIISNTGMPFSAVLTATVLVCAFSSCLMGLYAKNPIIVAPGMGLNAFFTYSVVLGIGVSWQTALGAVFWSGIIFLLLSVFNIRTRIVAAIPGQIRYGVAAGIGLFISLIGFANGGLVTANPATILGRGELNCATLTFLAGLGLTAIFVVRKLRGALIMGIILTTVLAAGQGRLWGTSPLVSWQGIWAPPDFSALLALDLKGSLTLSLWPVIFAFLFTDMFDSLSTFVGIAEAGNIKDPDGEPRNIKQSLIVDSLATAVAGLVGSSAGTSYIESATGIREGGRSGLVAVVAGLLFLPFIFFSPLLSMVPKVATAPALVLVGVYMLAPITRIEWRQLDNAIPAFLAMFLIPLCYSITQGIIWGFLSWTLVKCASGKTKEIPVALWAIDLFALLSLTL